MSRCGRTQLLEAVATGEASPAQAAELRAHARQCALCRHELNWLETESALFRHHAGRDEVAHLWAGVAQRSGLGRRRPWGRVVAGAAAALVLVLAAGRFAPPRPSGPDAADEDEALESSPLMSPVLFFSPDAPCSTLPSGLGFSCGPAVPASFLAAR